MKLVPITLTALVLLIAVAACKKKEDETIDKKRCWRCYYQYIDSIPKPQSLTMRNEGYRDTCNLTAAEVKAYQDTQNTSSTKKMEDSTTIMYSTRKMGCSEVL